MQKEVSIIESTSRLVRADLIDENPIRRSDEGVHTRQQSGSSNHLSLCITVQQHRRPQRRTLRMAPVVCPARLRSYLAVVTRSRTKRTSTAEVGSWTFVAPSGRNPYRE
jgi:hypothetical protein